MPTDQMIDYVPGDRVESGAGVNAVRIAGVGMFVLLLATYSLNAMDRQIFPLLLNDVRHQFGFSLSSAGSAFDGLHVRDGLRRATDRLVDGASVTTRDRADRHRDLFGRDCPDGARRRAFGP